MITCIEFIQSEIASDLALALLHTLWQGFFIALVLLVILKQLSNQQAQWRYRWCVAALLLLVMCGLGTFSILQRRSDTVYNTPAVVSFSTELTETSETVIPLNPTALDQTQSETLSPATTNDQQPPKRSQQINPLSWAISLWLIGVAAMMGRLAVALTGTYRLKQQTLAIEDMAILDLFEKLCQQMNMPRKIRLAASSRLLQPGVIGFFRPMLLVPVSMLSEIAMDDLQAILAHELAHIRRYDYLVNFSQMMIEAALFFNPFMWWISHQIRVERESCCDMAGVETAGEPVK
ncbi:MAG: M56 family metallopeptidase, partial [Planctomycetes bacterium]|nr:M56 family metallopeptidase [Planctomycetota bacterium]